MIRRYTHCEKCNQYVEVTLHRYQQADDSFKVMWRCDHCLQNAKIRSQPNVSMTVLEEYGVNLDDLPIYSHRLAITTSLENALKQRQERLQMARIICENVANDSSRIVASKIVGEWLNCDCDQLCN